jgi:hypothetical protein
MQYNPQRREYSYCYNYKISDNAIVRHRLNCTHYCIFVGWHACTKNLDAARARLGSGSSHVLSARLRLHPSSASMTGNSILFVPRHSPSSFDVWTVPFRMTCASICWWEQHLTKHSSSAGQEHESCLTAAPSPSSAYALHTLSPHRCRGAHFDSYRLSAIVNFPFSICFIVLPA